MEESDFKIAIIGLGIIGGSMAYALRGFKDALLSGCDIDPETRRKALESNAVDEVWEHPAPAIKDADLVILCVYPDLITKIISENKGSFKPGAVITDVCGIKSRLSKEVMVVLPENCQYVGGHPMAGRETDGFDSASPDLFDMCGYIITPTDSSTKDGIALVKNMAEFIGATRITTALPEEHDEIIAYTSDLMHISASALCLEYNRDMNMAYTAGAYRDCTRIANINPQLWSKLFVENKEHLLPELDTFISSLNKIRKAIDEDDKEELVKLLSVVKKNKLEMQSKEPKNN